MVMWCLSDKARLGWVLDLQLDLIAWRFGKCDWDVGVLVVLWYARKPCSVLYFQFQLRVAKLN
jgi:hypothetical protein